MAVWSAVNRVQNDLVALEQSVERAGLALGCAFSSHQEFEAAMVRTRRGAHGFDRRRVAQMRLALGVTAGLCAVMLIALAI